MDSVVDRDEFPYRGRDKYAIWATMLKACMDVDGGITRTHIMYNAMMSHEQCKKYLEALLTAQLLKFRDDVGMRSVKYETTLKGVEFIDTHAELSKMVPDVKVKVKVKVKV